MADTPLVSVVIPTYERAALVGRAIRSVLGQTMGDFELIVVDDGSQDDTEAVVTAWRDARITFLKHDHNMGSSAARNTGIRRARGAYVALLDSDDEWLPAKLERQLALFERSSLPQLGAVNCGLIIDRGEGLQLQSWAPSARGWVFWSALALQEYHDTASMWLIKKACLDALDGPFDPHLPYVQVSDFLVRLSSLCQFDNVSEPLVIYHDHNLWPRNEHYPIGQRIASYRLYMEKHEEHLKKRPDIHGRLLTLCATRYLGAHMHAEARRELARAVRLDPSNWRAWALLALARIHPRAYDVVRRFKRRLTGERLNNHRPYPG